MAARRSGKGTSGVKRRVKRVPVSAVKALRKAASKPRAKVELSASGRRKRAAAKQPGPRKAKSASKRTASARARKRRANVEEPIEVEVVSEVGDRSQVVWLALADPTRRALVSSLRDGPQTTGSLAREFQQLTRFGVMKHLEVLVDAGLVSYQRIGKQRWNILEAGRLVDQVYGWLESVIGQADQSSA
jgi:DNA-binding transcriptional ArsR family regulator